VVPERGLEVATSFDSRFDSSDGAAMGSMMTDTCPARSVSGVVEPSLSELVDVADELSGCESGRRRICKR
jgi:hypothetical protein